MNSKKWTDEEIELLRKHYPITRTEDVCRMLGRSRGSIYSMVACLGIKKTEDYLKQHVYVMDPKIGKSTRFKPGQKPVNKGKKMPKDVYDKVRKTMFKKGQMPHNTLSNGTITTRTDKNGIKRPFIRVELGKWVEMKNHVWQLENGTIPKGFCIALKDGNPFNYQLENLECISRQENMARNTIHNYPEEIKQTIRVLTKVKRELRNGEE